MKWIMVLAFMTVKPGYEDVFRHAAEKLVLPSRSEPGNLAYEFHQSADNPSEFVFVEKFVDEEAFEKHRQSPHIKRFLKKVQPITSEGDPRILQYFGY